MKSNSERWQNWKMKGLLATLLFFLLVLNLTSSIATGTQAPRMCGSECARRCAKAGMKDRCVKFCGICCRECNCVPSGTFGNKHECPCYRDKRNSKGRSKCP